MLNGRGGVRPGAGRPPGSQNKTPPEMKALAQSYGEDAIMRLAELGGVARDPSGNLIPSTASAAVQVMALDKLLDRGWGKVTQQSDVEGKLTLEMLVSRAVLLPDPTLIEHAPPHRLSADED